MKRVVVYAAVLALLGGLVLTTEPTVPDIQKLAAFIPPTIGPYVSEADQTFDAESIFDYIDGAGEVYRSYNMKLLVARRFHKDGKPDIVVDLFDMGSPEDAFGVFTHDLDGENAGIGQGSNYKAGLLSFWKDRYFGSVFAEEETKDTKEAVLELGRQIARAIPMQGPKPKLLSYLPVEGLVADRVCYFHNHSVLNYHFFVADGDILLLEQTASAIRPPIRRPAAKAISSSSAIRTKRKPPGPMGPSPRTTCRTPRNRGSSGPRTRDGPPRPKQGRSSSWCLTRIRTSSP